MSNILITSAGRRVSLIKSFQKELKTVYPNAKVFASDSEPILSAGCHVADAYFEVPRLEKSYYIEELSKICKDNAISLIIPTIDTELVELARCRSYFKKLGITILISSTSFIKKCRNKRVIHDFFLSNGIAIAKEYSKTTYQLPLFIKPIDGSRSVDTYVIKNQEDFRDVHFKNDKLMFLEYLDHELYEEYTCDLYYSKSHDLKCVVPRKRIEVRDGEVYKAVTKNNNLVTYIRTHLSHIKGAVGCLTVQFFMNTADEAKIVGIEINPRFGGGYPLSYLAGANFPKWIIDEYLLNKTLEDQFNSWESDVLMIRYDDEILVHGYKG